MKNLVQEQQDHDEIACLAYRLWEQRGRPQGCDLEFWLEAERQMRSSGQPSHEPVNAVTRTPATLALQVRPGQATPKSEASQQLATRPKGNVKQATPRTIVSSAP